MVKFFRRKFCDLDIFKNPFAQAQELEKESGTSGFYLVHTGRFLFYSMRWLAYWRCQPFSMLQIEIRPLPLFPFLCF